MFNYEKHLTQQLLCDNFINKKLPRENLHKPHKTGHFYLIKICKKKKKTICTNLYIRDKNLFKLEFHAS